MPTYEYECTRCGTITSEFKPMSAPRRQRCPACRSKVELLISGGLGIVFKGEGFYVNDSRAPSRSRPGSPEGGSVAREGSRRHGRKEDRGAGRHRRHAGKQGQGQGLDPAGGDAWPPN